MLVSQVAFDWILTAVITGLFAVWTLYDGRKLSGLLREKDKRGDKAHQDKIFGSVIGIALAVLGGLGALNFHLRFGW